MVRIRRLPTPEEATLCFHIPWLGCLILRNVASVLPPNMSLWLLAYSFSHKTPRGTDREVGCSGANIIQYPWVSFRGCHLASHADLSLIFDEFEETSGGRVDKSCISAPYRLAYGVPLVLIPTTDAGSTTFPRSVRASGPRFCGRPSLFQSLAVLFHRPRPLRVTIGAVAADGPLPKCTDWHSLKQRIAKVLGTLCNTLCQFLMGQADSGCSTCNAHRVA